MVLNAVINERVEIEKEVNSEQKGDDTIISNHGKNKYEISYLEEDA